MTALMSAACEGHVKCMNLLIQSGADLNIPDVNGRTTLMRTAELISSNTDMCFSSLLKAGAEIDTVVLSHVASKFVNEEDNEGMHNLVICRFCD